MHVPELGSSVVDGGTLRCVMVEDITANKGDEIIQAILKNDLEEVQAQVTEADAINCYVGHESPLHVACQKGSIEIIKYLIENGGDINAKTGDFQSTPLHIAGEADRLDVARCLVDHGADINTLMLHRSTPLRVACVKGNTNIVEFLLENDAQIDIPDRQGRSPLISAVEQGHLQVVQTLLKHGCDKNQVDSLNRGPVFYAVRKRQPEILRALIHSGVNCDFVDMRGLSPLHLASRIGFQDIVRILVETGCNKNLLGHLGGDLGPIYTALWEAVQNGHEACVDTLLDAGADPDIADDNSLGSALFAMMMSNHCRLDILLSLLRAGANVNYQNAYGYSVLRFAIDKNWLSAAYLLVQADIKLEPEIHWLKEYAEQQYLSNDIKEFATDLLGAVKIPVSLKDQCRQRARWYLSHTRPIHFNVRQLDLPVPLKRILLYENLDLKYMPNNSAS